METPTHDLSCARSSRTRARAVRRQMGQTRGLIVTVKRLKSTESGLHSAVGGQVHSAMSGTRLVSRIGGVAGEDDRVKTEHSSGLV